MNKARLTRLYPQDLPRMAWWWFCGAVASACDWFAHGLFTHRHQVYLGSRYWRFVVKPAVFARDGIRGDVHHMTYGNQWREVLDELQTLTRDEHKQIHNR